MSSMKKSVFLLTLTLLAALCTAQDIREPPSVSEPLADQIPDEYIQKQGMFQLPCEATGKPEPTYIWLYNGNELDLNKQNIHRLERGTIEITDFEKYGTEEGEYQCVASNKYGKSLSQAFNIKVAVLTTTGKKEVIPYSGDLGKPLRIPKTEFSSAPVPSYAWKTVTNLDDQYPKTLVRNKRIVQDLEGNLYFTSLQVSDALENGGFYKIDVYNNVVEATLGGSYSRISVDSSMTPIDRPAARMYPANSMSDVAVLEGTEMRIQCIFSGYPEVDVTWSGPSKILATPEESGTRLVLKTMTKEAAGEHECTGTNRVGSDRSKITVEMHTIPKFTPNGKPSKQVLTEGETATFMCQTTENTHPQATVQWMINGVLVQEGFPGARTEVTTIQNGKMLTIIKLNREEDIKVVQCKASNMYKTLYADASLNVLKKTTLTEKPVNQMIESDSTHIIFVCRATSDPSTPPLVQWQRDGKHLSFYDDPKMIEDKSAGTLTLNLDGLVEDQKAAYGGEYKCMATNGFSSTSHTAVLGYKQGPDDTVREPPDVEEPPADKIPADSIRRGGKFQLPCEATGKPTPTYIWMHNGKELDLNKTNIRHLEMGTIEISDFEKYPGDEGEYQCVASNKYGKSLSQAFRVRVGTIPKFTQNGKPSKQVLTEGLTATFTCQTTEDTHPQATIQWMINGVLVQDEFPGARTKWTTTQNGKQLTISDLNRDEDMKVIQCKASNRYKALYINAPLIVLKKTRLTERPADQLVEPNTTKIVLECRATTDTSTPLVMQWQRDGKTLLCYDDTRMTENKTAGTLTLNMDGLVGNQKAAYSGEYMCMATNGYSTDAHTAVVEYRVGGSLT